MFDVLIVGAGVSGLTAAVKILEKDPSLRVKVIEANSHLGGQLNLFKSGPELGGKFIKADQTHIYKFLIDLGVPMRRSTPVSRNLRRSWSLDEGMFASIAKFELQRYMDDLDLKSQLFWPGSYKLSQENRKYSMCDHIKSTLFFNSSRNFMANFVRLVTGVDASDISYIEFMSTVHSCGSLMALMEMYIEPTQNVLEFSSEKLIEEIGYRIKSASVQNQSKITEIRHHEEYVEVTEENGTVHLTRVAILAIQSNHLEDIFITPPVPPEWEIPFVGEKYYITVFRIGYDESHWRSRGFSGNFYSEDPTIFAHEHKPNTLAGYILHGAGVEHLIKSIVLNSLAQCFGNEMTRPQGYSEITIEQTSLLNLPCMESCNNNRIIWSSSSTATLYRGCLNGAVQSGIRAAIEALLILRPQSISWQDMAEIQKASVVRRYPSYLELLKSSINVYNSFIYTAVGFLIYILIKNRNRFFNFAPQSSSTTQFNSTSTY